MSSTLSNSECVHYLPNVAADKVCCSARAATLSSFTTFVGPAYQLVAIIALSDLAVVGSFTRFIFQRSFAVAVEQRPFEYAAMGFPSRGQSLLGLEV